MVGVWCNTFSYFAQHVVNKRFCACFKLTAYWNVSMICWAYIIIRYIDVGHKSDVHSFTFLISSGTSDVRRRKNVHMKNE